MNYQDVNYDEKIEFSTKSNPGSHYIVNSNVGIIEEVIPHDIDVVTYVDFTFNES